MRDDTQAGKCKLNWFMIIWTKNFETGSEKIDLQHQMLIANINHLEEMLNTTNPTREECVFLVHLVEFLEAYADTHFKLEENCMEKYRCPVRAQNQEAHERFRGLFHQYKERCNSEGYKLELLRDLHEACRSWVQEHILQIDTQLRPCLPK